MKLYNSNGNYKLYHGNMLDMGEVVDKNTIDSIVCDPPYELNFMWKWWDNSWIAFQKETREKCLEVLKPWWYLLAFWGSRTYHRIACAIEDAGFEIRDCIMWLYGSWFPKSMNIWLAIDKKNWVESEVVWTKKQTWAKFKLTQELIDNWWFNSPDRAEFEVRKATNKRAWWWTALKPSYEPIIVARKPCEWSCTDNVIKYWVGGINIDECRVGNEELHNQYAWNKNSWFTSWDNRDSKGKGMFSWEKQGETVVNGRFPANTILDSEEWEERRRYFYCAKASKRDRDEWLEELEEKWAKELLNREENSDWASWNGKYSSWNAFAWSWAPKKNIHPTVKPTELMQYLVRLVTPNGWTVLDPFNWSGSTGKAVMYENKDRNKNYKYIWIELTEEYLPIAKARIEYVMWNEIKIKPKKQEIQNESREKSLFDF